MQINSCVIRPLLLVPQGPVVSVPIPSSSHSQERLWPNPFYDFRFSVSCVLLLSHIPGWFQSVPKYPLPQPTHPGLHRVQPVG